MAEVGLPPYAVWLREQMRRRGNMKAVDLGKQIGVSAATISRWQLGRTPPEPENCKKLADYFGVPLNMVYRKAGYPTEGDADPDAEFTAEAARARGLFEEGLEILRRIEERRGKQDEPQSP